ncbi:MAG: helix-turn-helix domain-containing protein [Bacilli bacterium]|nr:helix-turn-helix domain-containing protein [Bacilli bacterium]
MVYETDNILIGKRIKEAREKAGLTQSRLHEITDISITQISAYENGNRNIGLLSLKKIADATGTTMDELYSGKGEEKPIISTNNEGKLIINCITALFENGVISLLPKQNENDFVPMGLEYYYQIGFCNYVDILDDYVRKLADFERNKENYPNPKDFKLQLSEASAKKINNSICYRNKK